MILVGSYLFPETMAGEGYAPWSACLFTIDVQEVCVETILQQEGENVLFSDTKMLNTIYQLGKGMYEKYDLYFL